MAVVAAVLPSERQSTFSRLSEAVNGRVQALSLFSWSVSDRLDLSIAGVGSVGLR